MTETSKAKIPPDALARRCVEFARAVMGGRWALADSSERRARALTDALDTARWDPTALGSTPVEVLDALRAAATEIDRILGEEDLRMIPALSGGAS